VDRPALREYARKLISELAESLGLDSEKFILVMGPYNPETSKELLKRIRDKLREFGYAAFLEEEFNLHVSLEETSHILFESSALTIFVVTDEGIGRGWQYELGDLMHIGKDAEKRIAVYHEGLEKLPAPIRDLLFTHHLLQAQIIENTDHDKTTRGVVQLVNTFFLDL
jgi:hypothetical protein